MSEQKNIYIIDLDEAAHELSKRLAPGSLGALRQVWLLSPNGDLVEAYEFEVLPQAVSEKSDENFGAEVEQ